MSKRVCTLKQPKGEAEDTIPSDTDGEVKQMLQRLYFIQPLAGSDTSSAFLQTLFTSVANPTQNTKT